MARRVGIDITSALTQGGGIGRYTRELIQALAAVDPRTEYRLFSARLQAPPPVAGAIPTAANFHYARAPLGERWLYRLWYRLRLPLPVQWLTGRIDLFHSPDFVLPPVAQGIPTLLTVHDLSFVHYPDAFPDALVRYLNRTVPWSIDRASHVLADSQATRTDLIDLWEVPAEKVTVLYSGVHGRFSPPADLAAAAARVAALAGDWTPYVLAVGTVQPRKNYPLLVRAFRPVAERHPHHLLIAGGRGWLMEEVAAEIERQGLGGRVHALGFVDDRDLPALYSQASAFLFPSLYEGFGLPLLEAMACGVPVLASNSSSLPEVTGEAAILLDPRDEAAWSRALSEMLSQPEERQRLVAAGFERVQDFRWQNTARELLRVYDELL